MKLSIASAALAASLLATPLFCHSARADGVEPIQEVFSPDASQFDSTKYGKVAVVQWNPSQPTPVGQGVTPASAEVYKQQNRQTIADYVREAAQNGAKMVITPEFAIVNYPVHPGVPPENDDFMNPAEIKPYVESVPGPSTRFFSALARELKVYIHFGFAESDGGTFYNTVVAVDPQGAIVGKYRKINLFELENQFLTPGSEPLTYSSIFGTIGFAICADIYSGNPMSSYRGKADVVALSTSWARYNSGMSTFSSAARQGRFYVLAANQHYFPDSGVINPDGSTQSHIRQSEGIAYGFLPYKGRQD